MTETKTQTAGTTSTAKGYVNCKTCGAILGYTARVGTALMLHAYAYPPPGVRCGLESKRIAVRMLSGDVLCPHCQTWQEWNVAAERPWERR
ncbi:MAG TPA: hypothetical protein VFF68_02990 [Anaerolineaceae bacterium]|nr:hypothetical protein [Anaerolineaceae bacterium]